MAPIHTRATPQTRLTNGTAIKNENAEDCCHCPSTRNGGGWTADRIIAATYVLALLAAIVGGGLGYALGVPTGQQALELRQLLWRGSPTPHAVTGDDFEERATVWRRCLMRGPSAMMDIGPGAARFAVLDKSAAEYEDDLVGLVVVDSTHR